jgi:signal transduction histidine kinase/ActR/RegA family two-component response regulator
VPEWSFQRKLISGVIVICLLAIVSSGASLVASRMLIASVDNTSTGEVGDLEDARALQLIGVRYIANVHDCLLAGGKEFVNAARNGGEQLRERAGSLRARITNPGERPLLDEILAAEGAYQSAFERALTAPGFRGGSSASSGADAVRAPGNRLDSSLTALVAQLEAAKVSSQGAARTAVSRARALLSIIMVATVLLTAILCLLLIAALNRSYGQQTVARKLAERGQSQAMSSLSVAESAGRLKDEFLATVSHELRNPLAPILTWTQLLRTGTLDEEKTKRALEVIERNVMSQAQLIDDLLDVSRVVSGKFRLDVRPVDLLPLIKDAAESQIPASDAKQIRLKLVLDERAGLISGDSERLLQVMWNLISNAIKFTPKGGRVQVVLQRAESHVEVSVSDSGIGIAPDFMPHVFEPFRQGINGSMRLHGGLGLGLSIVRHIVELHGGEINAFSDGPDLGSKFTVKFPLLATVSPGDEPTRRHPIARDSLADVHLGRLDGLRVLIVEDEASAREALVALFVSSGAEIRAAGSAAEAFGTFEVWQPDVLVSDIAMPEEDGYSLIRRIRLRSPGLGGKVPALALTAYAKIEDRVTILGSGFQMYLSKPANPNELIAVVRSLANRRDDGNGVVS